MTIFVFDRWARLVLQPVVGSIDCALLLSRRLVLICKPTICTASFVVLQLCIILLGKMCESDCHPLGCNLSAKAFSLHLSIWRYEDENTNIRIFHSCLSLCICRDSPLNRNYSRASGKDSLSESTSNIHSRDKYGSNIRDSRESNGYKSRDSSYSSRSRDVHSYNRENLSRSQDYSGRNSVSYSSRDIYGQRDRTRDDDSDSQISPTFRRRNTSRSSGALRSGSIRGQYPDEDEDRRLRSGSLSDKTAKKKRITCNLSGTRYEVGK